MCTGCRSNYFGDDTVSSVPAWQTSIAQLVGASAAIYAAATTIPAATNVTTPIVPVQPGVFAPGGFVAQNQTALLVGAAGLALWFLMKKKGRR